MNRARSLVRRALLVNFQGAKLMLGFPMARRLVPLVTQTLLALLSFIVGDGRHRLGAEVLGRTRGANGGQNSYFRYCERLADEKRIIDCGEGGAVCATCGDADTMGPTTYDDIGNEPGNMTAGTPNSAACGNYYTGTCNQNLICNPNTGGDSGDGCPKAPNPPSTQNEISNE